MSDKITWSHLTAWQDSILDETRCQVTEDGGFEPALYTMSFVSHRNKHLFETDSTIQFGDERATKFSLGPYLGLDISWAQSLKRLIQLENLDAQLIEEADRDLREEMPNEEHRKRAIFRTLLSQLDHSMRSWIELLLRWYVEETEAFCYLLLMEGDAEDEDPHFYIHSSFFLGSRVRIAQDKQNPDGSFSRLVYDSKGEEEIEYPLPFRSFFEGSED